jgi:glycosyltransferase involved in cell wall biosynthesis
MTIHDARRGPTTPPSLAIVIPAYKADFLAPALASLAAQTCRDFRVYVGDDASPHDLETICRRYEEHLPLHYTRFDENRGQQDLVAQWERCVALSTEPWVWLFSDDDVMDPDCVATLLRCLRDDAGRYDLYHFNVRVIDASGAVLRVPAPYPEVFSSLAFAMARLRSQIDSFAPDYVFARRALEDVGGFTRFPLAWCSDDATWIKLSRRSGIRTVHGPMVSWRISGQNITSHHPTLAPQKLQAARQFVTWLSRYVSSAPPRPGEPSGAALRRASLGWLWRQGEAVAAPRWQRCVMVADAWLRVMVQRS